MQTKVSLSCFRMDNNNISSVLLILNDEKVLNPFSFNNITYSSSSSSFCTNLQNFGNSYKHFHGYLSLTICILGTLTNLLNLVVLTRPEMSNSTNIILAAIALADLLNMVEYIPYTIYMNFLPDSDGNPRKTQGWAWFVLGHANFSQVCHTISISLTLTLAVWRYIMIVRPTEAKLLCCMQRAKMAVFVGFLLGPIICLPIYFTFAVGKVSTVTFTNLNSIRWYEDLGEDDFWMSLIIEKYFVGLSDLAKKYPVLLRANFWLYRYIA